MRSCLKALNSALVKVITSFAPESAEAECANTGGAKADRYTINNDERKEERKRRKQRKRRRKRREAREEREESIQALVLVLRGGNLPPEGVAAGLEGVGVTETEGVGAGAGAPSSLAAAACYYNDNKYHE